VAEHERPPVGSVAEEAARLLDALGGWAGARGYAATAGERAEEPPGERADEPPGERTEEPLPGERAEEPLPGERAEEQPDEPAATASRCSHCGAQNGTGQAVVCQLCPLCQGIGLLRAVRPETVDRLADLAGAIAATLRDLAAERHTEAAGTASSGGRHGGPGEGSRVQNIPIEDIDIEDHDEGSAAP
jgi:hypothetical protein